MICQPAGEFPADSLFQPRPRRRTYHAVSRCPADCKPSPTPWPGKRASPSNSGKAREIRRDGKGWVVRTDRGEYGARALCLATPVATATQLLHAPFPEVAGRLAEIETAQVESVGVALPAARLSLPPVAG